MRLNIKPSKRNDDLDSSISVARQSKEGVKGEHVLVVVTIAEGEEINFELALPIEN